MPLASEGDIVSQRLHGDIRDAVAQGYANYTVRVGSVRPREGTHLYNRVRNNWCRGSGGWFPPQGAGSTVAESGPRNRIRRSYSPRVRPRMHCLSTCTVPVPMHSLQGEIKTPHIQYARRGGAELDISGVALYSPPTPMPRASRAVRTLVPRAPNKLHIAVACSNGIFVC